MTVNRLILTSNSSPHSPSLPLMSVLSVRASLYQYFSSQVLSCRQASMRVCAGVSIKYCVCVRLLPNHHFVGDPALKRP